MEDKNPIISIIIPVYNVEKYLERCVNSLVNQTFKEIEILLVNDGSTDNSGALCDEFAKKYDNVRAIHKPNGGCGPSEARNMGLELAKGQYIGFIDTGHLLTAFHGGFKAFYCNTTDFIFIII